MSMIAKKVANFGLPYKDLWRAAHIYRSLWIDRINTLPHDMRI